MRLSIVVAALADELARGTLPLTADQLRLVGVLKDLPDYVDRGLLVDWDQELRAEIAPITFSDPAAAALLQLVYDLAMLNLYGTFDEPETNNMYHTVRAAFGNAGLATPNVTTIDDW
jgi:hypothetical protein